VAKMQHKNKINNIIFKFCFTKGDLMAFKFDLKKREKATERLSVRIQPSVKKEFEIMASELMDGQGKETQMLIELIRQAVKQYKKTQDIRRKTQDFKD
jgi:hypothetical protein